MGVDEDTDHPLKRWRQKQQPPLSQAEFGALVDRTGTAVSRWEARVREPDLADLAKIETATHGEVTRDDFMPPLPGSASRSDRVLA